MAGIADVARSAGVSKATASRALSGSGYVSHKTRDRVLEAAASLGYVPSTAAVSLATGKTKMVGVVMPNVSRWFFAEVLEGIQDALLRHGYDLTLYDARPGTQGRARVFDDFLARKRFDGLIAVGIEPSDHELERLVDVGRPLVSVVGEPRPHERRRRRRPPRRAEGDRAPDRSAAHQHRLRRRRWWCTGPMSTVCDCTDTRRPCRMPASRPATSPSPVTIPGGYAAAVDLLGDARRRPTAIVGTCDEVAIGAIIAARRLGLLVPVSSASSGSTITSTRRCSLSRPSSSGRAIRERRLWRCC